MKVFTVGMDQKPPIEKSESPPPGYASGTATPLPMGPEIAPIIVRKSRGYKGILMVMLAVFLMAIFALTLSEIAYNRQRDENFFRLQWAQLKHRFGYEHPQRIIPVNRGGADFPEIQALNQQKPDQESERQQLETPKIFTEPSSRESSSSSTSASSEQQGSENFVRDARLQFLRQILQRIKQNAEQMGFDGTMQVSVIEVEPQQMAEFAQGKKSPSEDPRSDAFLDSFGEFHAPPPFGTNRPPPPPMRELNENSIVPQQQSGRWPTADFGAFEIPMFPQQQMQFRPEPMAFRPPEWSFQQPSASQQGQQGQEADAWVQPPRHPNAGEEFAPSPSQEVMGEIYGRKFGRMLQDLIAARIQNGFMQQQQQQQQQQQPPMMQNMVMPMRPSFPIEQQAPQQVPQQSWWSEPQPSLTNQGQPQMSAQAPQQVAEQKPAVQEPASAMSQQPQVATNQQQQQLPADFGQNFPQPQFPVFVSPEDRIQIEPPNGGASWQPTQQQQQNSEEKQQMPPHAILDFMPPRGWTHQSESVSAPSISAPMVDNDVIVPPPQQPQQPVDEPQQVPEEPAHQNRIVILKKQQPLDGEKHEEFGSSQLSDLPMKELQGQLAAAAAALGAQQRQDRLQAEQQRFDEEAKNKNMDLQRPMVQSQEADLFKSLEQQSEGQAPSQEPPQQPPMIEIAEEETPKQQPVEPAPLTAEHNQEETSEQVDFPAVKFPNINNNQAQQQQAQPQVDSAPQLPQMSDMPVHSDQPSQQSGGGIFFQVDEPHQQQQSMNGFA